MDLAELRIANVERDIEWTGFGPALSLSFRGNELAGEVGEACNVIKKLERSRLGLPGSKDIMAHLAEELADVVICVDLIAMTCGLDMSQAVREKFNATSKKVGLKTMLKE
jgi:NTP pyrophosphatase (non-canonical NTP hydrolase)